jgi:hypothetical protein
MSLSRAGKTTLDYAMPFVAVRWWRAYSAYWWLSRFYVAFAICSAAYFAFWFFVLPMNPYGSPYGLSAAESTAVGITQAGWIPLVMFGLCIYACVTYRRASFGADYRRSLLVCTVVHLATLLVRLSADVYVLVAKIPLVASVKGKRGVMWWDWSSVAWDFLICLVLSIPVIVSPFILTGRPGPEPLPSHDL